ncbi:cytochrome C oxidase subunit IV family protein [Mucilaginibacter gossypii]|uniref:cytochrome C oxidase subunit IV family protein n=1 Tax=Mucilaginibacter gossypii TaxID=551996 RepID=UPI000DCDEED3|nr:MULTISPECIES: cytochrome C oxidase subunit IV family protein [Mucilaginibacter]QTE34772.1 cytochrome C oxidase subunit IV family protein [Mucilaginibacter gossypii]RAV49613.1 caa(3)-type oxidase [Mucilaginibacter rubeus]
MSAESHEVHHDGDHETMSKKRILQVAGILTIITCIEFFIALVCVPKGILPIQYANPVYIVLTLFKAFYIVAYFMHLKFEKMGLILSIAIPVIFIIGLILVLTNESHHWVDLR